ncbi:UdgX family uracil-DNA binding protein [Acuticoccus sp. MNP-M23]|uniref:UdgX family uracil-DNA binding protein n=1 Tax=Acuticoccus sp. MNP-M23 TaxID=3072793 RepID=UPI002814C33E|nr:UdgX family uracil-DNA binding protein [Acuticoccus sp. MNP-M23]WMS41228.1 UdgX family uracil-DNA binding protein [Acuticoccus sp. MNP-M23]
MTPAGPIHVPLDHPADFDGWRAAARQLVAAGIAPRDVVWGDAPAGLFGAERSIAHLPAAAPERLPRASEAFVSLAALVVCHRKPERFALLHTLLTRLQTERSLMRVASDPDVAAAETMAKNVRRCAHKMKAFVRFREAADPDGTARYVAWFEPEHHTLDRTAGFFVRRFPEMRWSILTPHRSAHWDTRALALGDGATRDIAPDGDVNEELWRTYYRSIFNPARLKVKTMQSEMPKRYWKNLPEASLIAPLIHDAARRTDGMLAAPARSPARSTRIAREREAAARDLAEDGFTTLEALTAAARQCTRCALHEHATQYVPGAGEIGAPLMFVGEQPGDQEDLAGRPFVGPAGQLFNKALAAAGIDRSSTFVTNAVKHFKFEPRGKRRLHKSPNAGEVAHCRFWLDHERRLVKPRLTVALGASAARSLSGRSVTIGKERGAPTLWADGSHGLVTVHPSYILRLPDEADQASEYARFVGDLMQAKAFVDVVAVTH